MKSLFKFSEEMLWTIFWVFLVLIIGFAILSFLANKFSGNIIGSGASWVESHAQAQG